MQKELSQTHLLKRKTEFKICFKQEDINYFSGGFLKVEGFPKANIHTSNEVANKCGLEKPIASGAMIEGIILDKLCEWFGKISIKLNIKFIYPIVAGDIIKFKIDEANNKFVNFRCVNQNNMKVVIGFAQCR